MRALALTCEAISQLDGVGAKVQCAAAHLMTRAAEDVAVATRFLSGTPLPPGRPSVRVGRAAVAAAVAARSGVPVPTLLRRGRDLGESVFAALNAAATTDMPGLTLREASACLADLGLCSAAGRERRLRQLFTVVDPIEAKYLAKLLTGEMRIGMQEARVEETIALAYRLPVDRVRRAHMLLGDIGEVARRAAGDAIDGVHLRCFRPVRYMLARSAQDLDEAFAGATGSLLVERGYEGLRAQLHVHDRRHRVYSRNLEDVTHQFPELGEAVGRLDGDWILDGEIVAFDGSPLPRDKLMQRLGRRQVPLTLLLDVPVVFRAFDVLCAAGRELLDEPLLRRKEALEELPSDGVVSRVDYDLAVDRAAVHRLLRAAPGNGCLYLKDPDSAYTPGQRGGPWRRVALSGA